MLKTAITGIALNSFAAKLQAADLGSRMSIFATEFPISAKIEKGMFLSQVIAWLRGNEFSAVLDSADTQDLDKTFAHIKAVNGEELIFRELVKDGLPIAIGFRHDLPDQYGRLWRTESVIKHRFPDNQSSFISFKTQCIAIGPTAKTDTPRKPYLIKSLIQDDWATIDGIMPVSDKPLWLEENPTDLNIARDVTKSIASTNLPVIYISAKSSGVWILNRRSIEKLAYELGGVAHVVVEPNRAFSFALRDVTQGQNAYGGAIAVIAPRHGILRKFYPTNDPTTDLHDANELRTTAISIRSQMLGTGWDWLSLQEACLHDQRIHERNRLSNAEIESIYQEEIDTRNERIVELEAQLASRPLAAAQNDTNEYLLSHNTVRRIGDEIYPNEFADRIRLATATCLRHAENDGLDNRTIAVLKLLMKTTNFSEDGAELRQDLQRACRDTKRITSEVTDLLKRHGYLEKSDNKHVRLEPRTGLAGLENITLSKTPGDHRSLENTRKQIERTLGLNKMKRERREAPT